MEKKITRVLELRAEYKRLLGKVEELEALCERSTSSITGMPRSAGISLRDDTWAELMDYKASCSDRLNDYVMTWLELDGELDRIKNPNIRTAMKYKYLDGETISVIAEKMSYTTRSIDRFLRVGRRIYESL